MQKSSNSQIIVAMKKFEIGTNIWTLEQSIWARDIGLTANIMANIKRIFSTHLFGYRNIWISCKLGARMFGLSNEFIFIKIYADEITDTCSSKPNIWAPVIYVFFTQSHKSTNSSSKIFRFRNQYIWAPKYNGISGNML